ncbi:MAG: hypothetical protein ABI183_14115 [Polyangiaceae bacterium]
MRFAILGEGKRRIFGLLLCVSSCHGACGSKSSSAEDSGAHAASVFTSDAEVFAPARCHNVIHRASLRSPLDIGDAITTNDGFAIGLVREQNVLSVALVSDDLAKITFVDIGPSLGETAPPLPFLMDKSVYVAWIVQGELLLGRIDNGKVAMIGSEVIDPFTFSRKDPVLSDIPVLDVAVSGDHGAAVWDFADPARGHVRFISFSKSGFDHLDGGLPYVEVAPISSDADSPRIAPRAGGGYWGIWVARKVEGPTDASTIEGPGESPTFRWLEAAPLDDHGTRTGAVVKLTPDSAHAGGYDVLTNNDGTDVIVRDATETPDEGTSIFRAHLSEKTSPAEIFASEIGRAEPDVVTTQSGGASTSWVVLPDMNDATRIVPIAKFGSGIPVPSIEPLLRSARALTLRSANSGVELLAMHALSVGGSPDQAEILLISCAPL